MYMYIYIYIHMYCAYMYVCVCIYIYIYIYIYVDKPAVERLQLLDVMVRDFQGCGSHLSTNIILNVFFDTFLVSKDLSFCFFELGPLSSIF